MNVGNIRGLVSKPIGHFLVCDCIVTTYINTLKQVNLLTCCIDHILLIVMLQVQPLADHAQIEEEQWWDIDRDELPADRPVYQDFN